MPKIIEGKWPENDLRRAFVAGAAWWQCYVAGFTMWSSERSLAEDEAEKRYGKTRQQPTPDVYVRGEVWVDEVGE